MGEPTTTIDDSTTTTTMEPTSDAPTDAPTTPCPSDEPTHAPGKGTHVSVCRDASYMVDSDHICSGQDDTPTGTVCPTAGMSTDFQCHSGLPSWDGKTCTLSEDTVCKKIPSGAWGCVIPELGCGGDVTTPCPSDEPTEEPTTPYPSDEPTEQPTEEPTEQPTEEPTTEEPTEEPTTEEPTTMEPTTTMDNSTTTMEPTSDAPASN